MKELDRRPANVEEVGLAYEAHKKIEEGSRDIGRELEYVTGLAKVMAAWTRERLDGRIRYYKKIIKVDINQLITHGY